MSNSIENYVIAVAAGHMPEIAATLSPSIKIMPPGGNQPNEGQGKGAMMLSAVAAVVTGFKAVRAYEGEENWYTVLLEGSLDETPLQFIDQVHLDANGLVDHIDIFLRPAPMASTLLAKVTEEIQKRTKTD